MKHLSHLTYHLLLEKPRSGYALVKEIEEKTGWKPSWGSIYPLLENLEEQELLAVKKKGRAKIYSLTTKGKKQANKELAQTKELLQEILERIKILDTITQEDLHIPINYLQATIQGEDPFIPLKEESDKLNQAIYALWEQNRLGENAKKINNTLRKARKEVEQL